MKRCFFVCGPESSGNRLLTRILVDAGCWGDYDMFQRLDKEDPPSDVNDIVIHRSFPFGSEGEGRHWPDIHAAKDRFKALGFEHFEVLVTMRDYHCTAHSQVKANHVSTLKQAMENISVAYSVIYEQITENGYPPAIHVTYEGLIYKPKETLRWLMTQLGLPMVHGEEFIFDANAKWYG